MRLGRTTYLSIAFALSSASMFSCLHAADPAPAPVTRGSGPPEKIEFSQSSSTAPKIPRPGVKDDDILNRFGNVPEISGRQGPDFAAPPAVQQRPTLPSKAAAEKLLKEWDRKKNWAVPGAQEREEVDPLAPNNDMEKGLLGEKPSGLMERFINGDESKTKQGQQHQGGPTRLRDLDRDRDRTNNKFNTSGRKDREDAEVDERDPRKDPNDNSESNGLAEFNLKSFIRQQNQPTFLNNEMPKASQLFRSNFGNGPGYRDPSIERAKERERDAARAAEFNQILRPRTTFAGVNDPINSPDLTRRELNPITPRSTVDSGGPGSSPFSVQASPASRIQENNILGVTGPAASSISSPISAPAPRIDATRAHQIIIEPPRRPF